MDGVYAAWAANSATDLTGTTGGALVAVWEHEVKCETAYWLVTRRASDGAVGIPPLAGVFAAFLLAIAGAAGYRDMPWWAPVRVTRNRMIRLQPGTAVAIGIWT